jgi:hypothetical protein
MPVTNTHETLQLEITEPDAIQSDLKAVWDASPSLRHASGRPAQPLAGTSHGAAVPDGVFNPYWSIVRWLPTGPFEILDDEATVDGTGYTGGTLLPVHRHRLTFTYSFAIPSPGDIAFLAQRLDRRPVIELGAGTGYWAWQLTQAGVDVLAYDSHQWVNDDRFVRHQYHAVHQGSVEKIPEHPDRVLMLCWPDYNTAFAAQALAAYTGDTLIYIGEGPGGCTADDEFDRALDAQWDEVAQSSNHVNFSGIHSHVGVYHRRGR